MSEAAGIAADLVAMQARPCPHSPFRRFAHPGSVGSMVAGPDHGLHSAKWPTGPAQRLTPGRPAATVHLVIAKRDRVGLTGASAGGGGGAALAVRLGARRSDRSEAIPPTSPGLIRPNPTKSNLRLQPRDGREPPARTIASSRPTGPAHGNRGIRTR
jgi:hypothetical protein